MRGFVFAAAVAGIVGSASAAEVRWSYGQHPEIGLSAHVTLPDGAYVGLVCGRRGGPAVRMIFSGSFFPARYRQRNPASPVPDMAPFTVSYAFDGARSHGGEMLSLAPRGGFQRYGTSCDVGIEELRTARSMWFFDQDEYHAAARAEHPEGDPPPDIAHRIARHAPVRMTLPLTGAREAIDRLIAACRPLADDIRNRCGI